MHGNAPDDPLALTVTGGLPWFGGPGNNYTTHAIIALADRLRASRDAFGLVHANGWHLTKHALGIYGGAPPPRGWQRPRGAAPPEWGGRPQPPEVVPRATGRGTPWASTPMHTRDARPAR